MVYILRTKLGANNGLWRFGGVRPARTRRENLRSSLAYILASPRSQFLSLSTVSTPPQRQSMRRDHIFDVPLLLVLSHSIAVVLLSPCRASLAHDLREDFCSKLISATVQQDEYFVRFLHLSSSLPTVAEWDGPSQQCHVRCGSAFPQSRQISTCFTDFKLWLRLVTSCFMSILLHCSATWHVFLTVFTRLDTLDELSTGQSMS